VQSAFRRDERPRLDDAPDFDDGEERIGVSFPQEWLRDPDSPWLRDYPVDLPWEEPELIEAMIAWRG
jgi:hypothetical protein